MGREVRRVPSDWDHPKDSKGHYIPLHEPEWSKEDGVNPRQCMSFEGEPTHLQMYENVTEGTPISPPMPDGESLARWLADNDANAGAGSTATYDQWLSTVKRGFACSMIIGPKGIRSGVEAMAEED